MFVNADMFMGFEEIDGDDDIREEFPCPFCSEYFDIVGLCCHIDDEHTMESKNGVFTISFIYVNSWFACIHGIQNIIYFVYKISSLVTHAVQCYFLFMTQSIRIEILLFRINCSTVMLKSVTTNWVLA